MALACARMPKVAICYIRVAAPSGFAACLHIQEANQEDSGLLAPLSHLYMVPPTSVLPPPGSC